MTRVGLCGALVLAGASMMAAQAAAPQRARVASPAAQAFHPPQTFQKYCFECHGGTKRKGGVSIERLIRQSAQSSVGGYWDEWNKIAEMLETRQMPIRTRRSCSRPMTNARRRWRGSGQTLSTYEAEHAGDPGRVTVRRLTSAEYAYALRDLTGIDIKVGVDASSDSVGGEGFTNFGDVQFVEATNIERYLEAAKQVADHAVIGAGPLEFYADPGKTGLELSALNRINELYASKGFRVVSGEGGRPFGLDRYGKAFFVAWYYKHRVALGDPTATIRGLAAKEGITGRFADHIWMVVNKADTGYPTRETVDGWKNLPGADVRRRRVAGQGPRRMRRALQVADDVAELVLCSRRSGGRRRGRREPAGVRRHDAQGRADSPLHVRVGRSRRSRARRARRPVPRRCISHSPTSIRDRV